MRTLLLCLLLTACGGGCDDCLPSQALQHDGHQTIQPVNCAASGACS